MSVDVRPPAYKVLADDLRAQITSGQLRPGDRLPTEPQLCQNSGVSRSTVREALRLLASQHLIVTTRGVAGGSFVVHPSPAQIADALQTGVALLQASSLLSADALLEVRAIVEIPAAGLAASRRTDEQLAALRTTLFDPHTAHVDDMVAVHQDFHAALAGACANPLIEVIAQPLQAVSNVLRLAETLDRGDWVRVDREHRAILAAIESGNSEAASVATAAHIDNLRELWKRSQLAQTAGAEAEAALVEADRGADPAAGAPVEPSVPVGPSVPPGPGPVVAGPTGVVEPVVGGGPGARRATSTRAEPPQPS